MKQFQGRVICPGTCEAEALVSHGGFNTLASYQMALMFHDKQVKCGDQNNPDLYKKPMIGKAAVPAGDHRLDHRRHGALHRLRHGQPARVHAVLDDDRQPRRLGAILAANWTDANMPVVDQLGDEFLSYVHDGMRITVSPDGTVTVE